MRKRSDYMHSKNYGSAQIRRLETRALTGLFVRDANHRSVGNRDHRYRPPRSRALNLFRSDRRRDFISRTRESRDFHLPARWVRIMNTKIAFRLRR